MKELLRTNDMVLISWAEALLSGRHIPTYVLDANMSILEGSANAIPRRLMVADEDFAAARRLIDAARAELDMAADIPWGGEEEGAP
ncbi:MAG: DUF2007 domain-containing protein [Alphaproteobacteria bacterium]|nr:DUF2007 domain-containing protein [Alphaproteobacteria bacterium]